MIPAVVNCLRMKGLREPLRITYCVRLLRHSAEFVVGFPSGGTKVGLPYLKLEAGLTVVTEFDAVQDCSIPDGSISFSTPCRTLINLFVLSQHVQDNK
jgi:hypothetical protein